MYEYFYNFNKRTLGDGLFRQYAQNGTPPTPPPTVTDIITEDGKFILSEDGKNLITES